MTPTPSRQYTVPHGWKPTPADKRKAFHAVFDRPWYHCLQPGPVMACIIAGAIIMAAFIGAAQAMPNGYATWCAEDSDNCPVVEDEKVVLDDALNRDLRDARQSLLFSVRHSPEKRGNEWRYPYNGMGDCEDIAIWLREDLEDRGVAMGAMRFAVGPDELGRPHAWLVIKTDGGLIAIDAREIAPLNRFHAAAELIESTECTPGYGCAWRPHFIENTRVALAQQDRR